MSSDLSQLGSIMGIWAHPDDETFMVGGLLSMAAANGQQVVCITATKGEAGVQNESRWSAETLGETRSKELAAALEILGIGDHHWLDYKDGVCSEVDETEAVAKLVAQIEQYKPDTIITFAPDGLTGHDDHIAVARWASLAAEKSSVKPTVWCAVHTQEIYDAAFKAIHDKFNVYFNIDVPRLVPMQSCDLVVELPDEVLDKKLAALQAMPSQYETFFQGISPQEAELAFDTEALIKATKSADL
jgi:LmbE family N-acetylglucosaminyl deacetylase